MCYLDGNSGWESEQNRVKSDSHYLRHLLFTAPYTYLDLKPPQKETWDSPTSPKLSKTIITDLSYCSRPRVLRCGASYTQLRFTVLKEPADIAAWEVTQRWQLPRCYFRRWKPTEEVKVSGRHLSGPAYKAGCLWEALWFEAASSALAAPFSCTNFLFCSIISKLSILKSDGFTPLSFLYMGHMTCWQYNKKPKICLFTPLFINLDKM